MSGVDRNFPSLHARNRRDVTIMGIVLAAIRSARLHRFRGLLRPGGAARRGAEIHDDARLPPAEGEYLVAVFPDRGLYHNTHGRRIELSSAHAGDERGIDGDIFLIRRHNPSVLHVHNDARRICENALPIGNGAVGIDDNAHIPVHPSDANPCDLCHILGAVAECSLCRRSGRSDPQYADEKYRHP